MNPVHTLSVHNTVTTPKMGLSFLLSNALTTYQSQCWVMKDYTVSIPYYVQIYSSRPDTLVEQLQSALESYFLRYFNQVVVHCSHNASVDNTAYKLTLSVHAIHNGTTYDIADSFDIKDSAITRTINAFNGDGNAR